MYILKHTRDAGQTPSELQMITIIILMIYEDKI